MKFRSQCPHTKRCWNTATATRPRAVSPGGTEWTQDRARGPQGPEVLAVGPGRGWNCRGPHAGPEGRRTRTALGGQVREERNGGKIQGLEQGRRPAAPPAPGSATASRRGLGPWPLPNHPGWPAAARTAPRAPRCTPGASFPHVRRCSLTLSCLYSWMKKGGDRTRPVSVPPLVTAKPRCSTSTPSRHISRWCYFVSLNMCLLISIHNDYVYQLLNFEQVN